MNTIRKSIAGTFVAVVVTAGLTACASHTAAPTHVRPASKTVTVTPAPDTACRPHLACAR